MKRLLLFLSFICFGLAASAQINTIDSLEKYINRFIRTSPVEAFQNLRLNTALNAMLNFVDSARNGSQFDTIYSTNDSTIYVLAGSRSWTFTIRGTGGSGGGGSVNLTMTRNGTTVTITPSSGTAAVIPAATTSNAGIMTATDKAKLDSAVTHITTAGDSITCFYRSGTLIRCDTVYSTALARPLYAVDSRTIGVKNDSAAWNAKQLQGRAIASTAPTDGQAIVWDNAGNTWKPGTVSGGGGISGLTTNRVTIATSSTSIGDDAGMTYDATTNQLNVDSIKLATNISLQRMLRNLGGGIASDSIGFGACVIRGNASGGSGSLISWSFIDDLDHTKTFFTNVYANSSSSTIRLVYPEVGKILSMTAVPDETLAGRGLFLGTSVGDTSTEIYAYQHIISSGYLTGNGTNFTATGHLNTWTTSYNSGTGAVTFTPPATLYYNTASDANHMSANYVGSNNYRLRRKVSGLGSDIAGWVMVDNVTNTDVTGAPTTSDIIEVTGLPFYRQVSAYQVSGSLYEANIWAANSNIWIFFTYKK